MATLREHIRINRPADEVWKVVGDAAGISTWFPGIDESSIEGDVRTIRMGDMELVEDVVTNDAELRRFQYAIRGGAMPVTSHLGTIDVIEDGDGSLVVYSAEISPDELGAVMGPALVGGLQGLKTHCEGS